MCIYIPIRQYRIYNKSICEKTINYIPNTISATVSHIKCSMLTSCVIMYLFAMCHIVRLEMKSSDLSILHLNTIVTCMNFTVSFIV